MLVNVETFDPITFGSAAVFLAGVGALASYLPALQVTRGSHNRNASRAAVFPIVRAGNLALSRLSRCSAYERVFSAGMPASDFAISFFASKFICLAI